MPNCHKTQLSRAQSFCAQLSALNCSALNRLRSIEGTPFTVPNLTGISARHCSLQMAAYSVHVVPLKGTITV